MKLAILSITVGLAAAAYTLQDHHTKVVDELELHHAEMQVSAQCSELVALANLASQRMMMLKDLQDVSAMHNAEKQLRGLKDAYVALCSK